MPDEQPQLGVTQEELIFYAACFAAACCGSIFTTLKDDNYRRFGSLFGLCGSSGLLAVFIISVLTGGNGGAHGSEFYYVTFSGVVGLFSKIHDRFLLWILYGIISRLEIAFGFRISEHEDSNHGLDSTFIGQRPDVEEMERRQNGESDIPDET